MHKPGAPPESYGSTAGAGERKGPPGFFRTHKQAAWPHARGRGSLEKASGGGGRSCPEADITPAGPGRRHKPSRGGAGPDRGCPAKRRHNASRPEQPGGMGGQGGGGDKAPGTTPAGPQGAARRRGSSGGPFAGSQASSGRRGPLAGISYAATALSQAWDRHGPIGLHGTPGPGGTRPAGGRRAGMGRQGRRAQGQPGPSCMPP